MRNNPRRVDLSIFDASRIELRPASIQDFLSLSSSNSVADAALPHQNLPLPLAQMAEVRSS
jgi:hypothetical protein